MRHDDAPDVPVAQNAPVALKIKEVQMNELKAQLIKNMQAELDKLKEDLLNISSQEILSRAYEYAVKTEIIYAAHDANLNNYQIKALLKHPSPLNDVYSK